jgi:hypothetical protein
MIGGFLTLWGTKLRYCQAPPFARVKAGAP